MEHPPQYWFWFLAGPNCPAARPFLGSAAGEPTLPPVLTELAETSASHWWLHAGADRRRHLIHLRPRPSAPVGQAFIDDFGAELNLRSYNASTSGQDLHAYLIEGDPAQL